MRYAHTLKHKHMHHKPLAIASRLATQLLKAIRIPATTSAAALALAMLVAAVRLPLPLEPDAFSSRRLGAAALKTRAGDCLLSAPLRFGPCAADGALWRRTDERPWIESGGASIKPATALLQRLRPRHRAGDGVLNLCTDDWCLRCVQRAGDSVRLRLCALSQPLVRAVSDDAGGAADSIDAATAAATASPSDAASAIVRRPFGGRSDARAPGGNPSSWHTSSSWPPSPPLQTEAGYVAGGGAPRLALLPHACAMVVALAVAGGLWLGWGKATRRAPASSLTKPATAYDGDDEDEDEASVPQQPLPRPSPRQLAKELDEAREELAQLRALTRQLLDSKAAGGDVAAAGVGTAAADGIGVASPATATTPTTPATPATLLADRTPPAKHELPEPRGPLLSTPRASTARAVGRGEPAVPLLARDDSAMRSIIQQAASPRTQPRVGGGTVASRAMLADAELAAAKRNLNDALEVGAVKPAQEPTRAELAAAAITERERRKFFGTQPDEHARGSRGGERRDASRVLPVHLASTSVGAQ